jgi:hypothetical protein
MAWLRRADIEAQSELLFLNTVRLCFAPTFTKEQGCGKDVESNTDEVE